MTTARFTKGFTLIEFLVVMTVIGLGLFALLPRLDLTASDQPGDAEALTTLAARAANKAREQGMTQEISFRLASDLVVWNEEELRLSADLSSMKINDEQPSGLERLLRVRPEGYMDRVDMRLAGGAEITGDPLSAVFAYE